MLPAHKIELRPTASQSDYLGRACGARRHCFNQLLAHFKQDGVKWGKAAEEWSSWIAALIGTMGERTEKGFTLANPGLQVFERKPKADTAMPVTDTPPAEPVAPSAPAAPVIVTTKAGTATVTVAKRAPLTLKR